MTTSTSISHQNNQEVANALSNVLANEYILLTKTKNAHWKVTGPDFMEKHHFFDFQISQLDKFIDQVADSIRAIGHYAPAKLKSFIDLTQQSVMTKETTAGLGFINELVTDHENIIKKINETIPMFTNDYNHHHAGDFITSLMEEHQKMAWTLRSQLQA